MDQCIRKRYKSAQSRFINMAADSSMVMSGRNTIMVKNQLIAGREVGRQASGEVNRGL